MSVQQFKVTLLMLAVITPFLATPSYAQSEEAQTETLSLGVSGYWTHVRVAGHSLVGDGGGNAAAFGLIANVNVSDNFGFAAEIRAPYKVSFFIEEDDDPTASYGYDAQLLDTHISIRYRPLGRTEFAPFVDGGLTYVTALSVNLQVRSYVPQIDNRHKLQPHIGLGLSWNSGWNARDSHFDVLLRTRVPPLEPPGGPRSPRLNSDAWSWEIGLRARISLF